jgi:16S rRNA (uracil1498-N3)-methyltransferase
MKKIHWFTVTNSTPSNKNTFTIQDEEVVRQISRVLKLEVGESVVIKTDETAFEGVIQQVSREEVTISNLKEKIQDISFKKISLFFCIPKKDKFETILEKCTEIGVTDFYPVISSRTVKTDINTERSEKIIQEASEQAQRIDTPILHEIQGLEDIVKEYRPAVFDVEGVEFKKGENKAIQNILIGPEGGFTPEEIKMFKEHRLDIYKIGHTVLKTETAAIVISALVILE